jgi:DNA-binding NtrC family response regulator
MSIEPIPTSVHPHPTPTTPTSRRPRPHAPEPPPQDEPLSPEWENEFEEFVRQAASVQGDDPSSLRGFLDLAEAWKITRTLRACRGNRSAAARALGIGRRTLYAKMEKLKITPTWALGSK